MIAKMETFECEACGNSVLEHKGEILFGGVMFDCYECENCKNKILSERINGRFETKTVEVERISLRIAQI